VKNNARNEWVGHLKLLPGRYRYKFVVDGEWLIRPDAMHEVDQEGNINNVAVVRHALSDNN